MRARITLMPTESGSSRDRLDVLGGRRQGLEDAQFHRCAYGLGLPHPNHVAGQFFQRGSAAASLNSTRVSPASPMTESDPSIAFHPGLAVVEGFYVPVTVLV